jgi:hypothetical protein
MSDLSYTLMGYGVGVALLLGYAGVLLLGHAALRRRESRRKDQRR